jgi:MscS family membrane protein
MSTRELARATQLLLLALLAVPVLAARAQAENDKPLAPPDTSSPRAALRSFVENVEAAFRPFYLHEDRTNPFQSAAGLRALHCLDLSALPPAQAQRKSQEAVLLLAEIMARIELPAYDDVPGAEELAALPEGQRRAWRIPETAIEIARIEDGPSKGEFVFSAETVLRAREFYNRARDLPYRAGAMVGLYERVVFQPGELIPSAWVDALPWWMRRPLGEQTVWQWIGLAIGLGAWLCALALVLALARNRDGEPRYWRSFFLTLSLLPLTIALRHYIDEQITIVGEPYAFIDTALVLIAYLVCAGASVALGSAIGETIIASPKIEPRSIDAHLIRMVARALAWLTALGFILVGASAVGVPLTALVTSLGVGGFAFALAARPALENLVAGVTLFIDKPVRVGTFCAFDDVIGAVEEIGMRSTRIRRWGGNRITIPNAQFAELRLDDYDDTRNLWIRTTIGLRYETTPDQLRFVLARIREMLVAHPKLTGEPRARLAGFGDYSLEVEILAYADTGNWTVWHGIREDVFLRVMDIVEESGTSFALPSQTTYIARDKALDQTRARGAEQAVKEWRESGELPFPDMAMARREELAGSVDFPPRGSVSRQLRAGLHPPPMTVERHGPTVRATTA